jgi:hypothetical protein
LPLIQRSANLDKPLKNRSDPRSIPKLFKELFAASILQARVLQTLAKAYNFGLVKGSFPHRTVKVKMNYSKNFFF